MSTNSRIGVLRDSNKVESIYCHWDGYPSYNGELLLQHWTDIDQINVLIALGDLSSLGKIIGNKHDFDTSHGIGKYENGIYTLTPTPASEGKWCCFYARDRGENNVASKTHTLADWPDCGQEYEYLFNPFAGHWTFRDCYGGVPKPFEILTPAACEEAA